MFSVLWAPLALIDLPLTELHVSSLLLEPFHCLSPALFLKSFLVISTSFQYNVISHKLFIHSYWVALYNTSSTNPPMTRLSCHYHWLHPSWSQLQALYSPINYNLQYFRWFHYLKPLQSTRTAILFLLPSVFSFSSLSILKTRSITILTNSLTP